MSAEERQIRKLREDEGIRQLAVQREEERKAARYDVFSDEDKAFLNRTRNHLSGRGTWRANKSRDIAREEAKAVSSTAEPSNDQKETWDDLFDAQTEEQRQILRAKLDEADMRQWVKQNYEENDEEETEAPYDPLDETTW